MVKIINKFSIQRNIVRSELKLGVNFSNNFAKYEVFSFQPIGALERRSMTSELKIQVSVLTIANE